MFRRFAIVLALLTVSTIAVVASEHDARTFIDEMIRGVGARYVVCPVEVTHDADSRQMGAVCARFDGDFESFETRWASHLRREAAIEYFDGQGRVPRMQAATPWEATDGAHERIYKVGRSAVGVRFTEGELLMVYK